MNKKMNILKVMPKKTSIDSWEENISNNKTYHSIYWCVYIHIESQSNPNTFGFLTFGCHPLLLDFTNNGVQFILILLKRPYYPFHLR